MVKAKIAAEDVKVTKRGLINQKKGEMVMTKVIMETPEISRNLTNSRAIPNMKGRIFQQFVLKQIQRYIPYPEEL